MTNVTHVTVTSLHSEEHRVAPPRYRLQCSPSAETVYTWCHYCHAVRTKLTVVLRALPEQRKPFIQHPILSPSVVPERSQLQTRQRAHRAFTILPESLFAWIWARQAGSYLAIGTTPLRPKDELFGTRTYFINTG